MFRQTIMRGAQKRLLEAGATNDRKENNKVLITVKGNPDTISEMMNFLTSGKPINSWGAKVENLQEFPSGLHIEQHQVHTGNVDTFDWNPDVTIYL